MAVNKAVKGDPVAASTKVTLKIWHRLYHGNATVTEDVPVYYSVCDTIEQLKDDGGFWMDNSNFIPWHRINHIEVIGEEDGKPN